MGKEQNIKSESKIMSKQSKMPGIVTLKSEGVINTERDSV